jgi:hypothetical protein
MASNCESLFFEKCADGIVGMVLFVRKLGV